MTKKIMIIVFMLTALCLVIIQPGEIHSTVEELKQGAGVFWGYVFSFYLVSGALLFWIGIPAGWNLAKEHFLGGIGAIILSLIGLYLSPIIAFFQLLKPTK